MPQGRGNRPSLVGTPTNAGSNVPTLVVTPAPGTTTSNTTTTAPPAPATPPASTTATPAAAAASTPATTPAASAPTTPFVRMAEVNTRPPEPARNPARATVSDAEMAAEIKKILSGVSLPNPLNDVRQPVYHFRLFMTTDIDPYAAGKLSPAGAPNTITELHATIDNLPQVTLAESGVTTYNIRSVEFDSTVAPNSETRITNVTALSISIVEPMGIGFVESVVEAGKKLNVLNYAKHFLYLELRFLAYNEDGSFNDNPCKSLGLTTGSRWMWRIVVNDISTHFDAGGGQYTLTCQAYDDHIAYGDENVLVPETINVAASTLGGFTDNLKVALNKAWVVRNQNSVTTYDFVWEKMDDGTDPSGFTIASAQADLSSIRQFHLDTSGATPSVTFQPGLTIPSFIEAVLETSEKAQQFAKDNPSTNATASVDPKRPKVARVFRIEPEVEITGEYEVYSQKYYRKITYFIRPYSALSPIINQDQTINALNPAVSWQAVRHLIDNNLCKKHYDYLYTGENTEVLDFDIKYNYSWAAQLPRAEGVNDNSDNITGSTARLTDNQAKLNTLNEKLTIERNTSADLAEKIKKNDGFLTKARDSGLSEAQRTDARKSLAESLGVFNPPNADLTDLTSRVAAQRTLYEAQSQSISDLAHQQSTLAQQERPSTTKSQSAIYSEDLLIPKKDPATGAVDRHAPRTLPISFQQAYRSVLDQASSGALGQNHRDRTVFSCVLGQLYAPEVSQFQTVDITIRGDPFWLGASNLLRLLMMRQRKSEQPDKNLPEFYKGQNCFVLKFRAPLRQGDDFAPVFNDSLVFNGVYSAKRVRNSFADGVFKQTITADRLPLIDILAAAGYKPESADFAQSRSVVATSSSVQAPGGNGGTAPTADNGTRRGAVAGAWINSERAQSGVQYLMSKGYTQAQATGIIANLGQESSLNTTAVGDGGKAIGVGQWHPDRQAIFSSVYGGNLATASFERQLDFVDYELRNSERGAGRKLAATSTPEQAAAVISQFYERPRDVQGNIAARSNIASQLTNKLNK